MKPTADQAAALQHAFDYFNARLFDDELPQALILIHRKRGVSGYFWAEQFTPTKPETETTKLDEIALTPETLDRGDEQVLSTLVHEMAHLWQHHFGKPSRNAYHNKEWADKMESIGLQPTTDGTPNGKRTGQKCTHLIMIDGDFKRECDDYLRNRSVIAWFGRENPRKETKKNKIVYECSCGNKVWGKPGLSIVCGECEESYEEQE